MLTAASMMRRSRSPVARATNPRSSLMRVQRQRGEPREARVARAEVVELRCTGRARESCSSPPIAASPPSIRVVSVISSAIRSGEVPVLVERVARSAARKPASLSSRAATLTLMRMSSGNSRDSMQARCRTQRPIAEISSRVLLGDRQEAARAEQPFLRVLPAHERLQATVRNGSSSPRSAGRRAAARRCSDRAPQAVLDPQAVAQAALHRAVEDLERVAAARLDALHRGVRALDQVRAAVARAPRSRSRSMP